MDGWGGANMDKSFSERGWETGAARGGKEDVWSVKIAVGDCFCVNYKRNVSMVSYFILISISLDLGTDYFCTGF